MFNFSKKKLHKDKFREEKKIIGTMIFTDIVSSSKLWAKNKDLMFKALTKHEKDMYKLVKKFNGMVVKTIGDSFMIYFKGTNYINALKFSATLQNNMNKYPIKVGTSVMKIRIGMCFGKMNKQFVWYQDVRLKDFLGQTVNIASRMESKVSSPDQFVISFSDKKDPFSNLKNLEKVLKSLPGNWKVKISDYKKNCMKLPKNRERSSRLLQGYKCLSPEKLKGVGALRTYIFFK